MAAEDPIRADSLVAAACRADVEGRVILVAVRDDAGTIVDMECLEATPAACVLLGLSRDVLVGRRWLEVFPEALSNGWFDEYVRVVETGRPAQREQHLMTLGSSGGERYVDSRIVRVADGVSHAFRDVTDRVGAEKNLAELELILRALTNHSREVVLTLDADGTVRYCSPSIAAVLGWEPEDLVGRERGTILHPDDRALLAAESHLGTGEADAPVFRVRHRDGSYRWIESSLRPIVAAAGSVSGHVDVWRDVSERVEADRRIAESEAQLRLLTENTQDVVLMANTDCIVTYCSPSVRSLLGWTPEELIGRPSNLLLHPDDFQAMVADPPQQVGPRRTAICTARLRSKDGSYRWVESANSSVLSPDGETMGFTATWRDVNDRVAAEAELERRAKIDFLTGLANRSEIIETISTIGGQADRSSAAVAILFCDVDKFKDINDRYGHAAGDAVLRTLGERISAAIGVDGRVGRIGGDEILVVLQRVRALADATAVADQIRQTASQRVALANGESIAPTLSIGATIMLPGESVDALMARADNAMYSAKQAGRDRVVAVHGPSRNGREVADSPN